MPEGWGEAVQGELDTIGHIKKRAFLAAFARLGTVAGAAAVAKISRQSHYNWLAGADYRQAFADAKEECIERLEMEADRRAVEGIEEPIFRGGV